MGIEIDHNRSRPWIHVERANRNIRLTAGGSWTVRYAAELDPELQSVAADGASEAVFDGSEIDELDSIGAWLLVRSKSRLESQGVRFVTFSVPDVYLPLIAAIETRHMVAPAEVEERDTLIAFLERVGVATLDVLVETVGILGYIGRITIKWFQTVFSPGRYFRLTATVHQLEEVGINALPIVGLLMFLVGIVLAYQGADQLRRFDLEILTVNALGIGVLRELGVLITAIIIAGRSGSAFTAQIGTMKVNEEIDAMRTIGLDVDDVLILPRVNALVIALPFLTFYANIMALIGGAVMCYFDLGITVPVFVRQLHQAITLDTFLVGMIKAPVFAYVIGMVGCYEGLSVERNAASVGRLTTRSVVESVFLVIVLDAGFSVIFSILGI